MVLRAIENPICYLQKHRLSHSYGWLQRYIYGMGYMCTQITTQVDENKYLRFLAINYL